ncbi:MAG: NUDIX domain-containing protein [Minisyncoccia bacterium]
MPHIHEKIDFAVEVFVVYNDKVLLRKHDKYGIWLSVGGHIELDEDPNEAALREVKEEVGLDVTLFDTRGFTHEEKGFVELIAPISLNRHNISDTHEHISMIYFAKANTDQVIPEKELDEWRWCAENEIETLEGIRKDIVHYAKRALKEVR